MASFYGGIPGESMIISKRYESKTEMNNNIDDIRVGEYVVISLEDDDNDSSGIGNIYKKNYSGELQFIGNFKGANGTHPKLQYNENLREGSEGETGPNIADRKISVPLETPNENESIQLLYKNDIANGIVFIKFLSFPNPAMKLNFNDSTGLFNFISSSSNATTNVKISSNKPLIENIQVYNVNQGMMQPDEINKIKIKINDNFIKVDSSTIPSFESIENFTNDTLILYKYTDSDVWECLTSFSEMIGNNNTASNSTTNSLDNYIEDIRFNNETGQLLIYNPNISIDFDNQNNPYNKNEGDFYKYDGYFNAVSGTGRKYYGIINLKSYIQQVISDMKEYINYKFDCNDAQIDVRLRFILKENENKIDKIEATIEIRSLTSSEENTVSFKNPNSYISINNATLTYLESDENNFINKIKTYFQEEGNTQENTKYFKIDGQYYQITSDFAEKIREYIMKFFDSNERKIFIRHLSSGYFLLYSLSSSVVDISSSGSELPQGILSDSDERILTVSEGQREHVVRFSNSNDDTSNNLFKNGLYLKFKTSAIDNNGRGLLS